MLIRPATMADAEILLSWRNDPLTRAMFKSQDLVGMTNHVAWLQKRLSQTDPNIFIAGVDGTPVGTVRVDADRTLSYTVAPRFRGRGYATQMLREIRARFGACIAEIKPDNFASIRAAGSAGHRVQLL